MYLFTVQQSKSRWQEHSQTASQHDCDTHMQLLLKHPFRHTTCRTAVQHPSQLFKSEPTPLVLRNRDTNFWVAQVSHSDLQGKLQMCWLPALLSTRTRHLYRTDSLPQRGHTVTPAVCGQRFKKEREKKQERRPATFCIRTKKYVHCGQTAQTLHFLIKVGFIN